MTDDSKRKPHGLLTFALDFGPLLAFFIAYKATSDIILSTGVFIVAIVLALVLSLVKLRRVSPMMWISAILIVGFGGLTIYLNDQKFIQIKPTIIYAGFAGLLLAGLAFRKALLKHVFGPIFPGLSEHGWLVLSRNWALFFAAMAVLNEVLRATLTFDTWLTVKVWGITLISVAFGMANIPMLLRHGFDPGDPKDETPVPPASL